MYGKTVPASSARRSSSTTTARSRWPSTTCGPPATSPSCDATSRSNSRTCSRTAPPRKRDSRSPTGRRFRQVHECGTAVPRRRSTRSPRRGTARPTHCTAESIPLGRQTPLRGRRHRSAQTSAARIPFLPSTDENGDPVDSGTTSMWTPHGAAARRWSVNNFCAGAGSVPGGTRRFRRADARGVIAAAEPTTGGQSIPRIVSAGRAHTCSADRTRTSQLYPFEYPGVGAELIAVVTDSSHAWSLVKPSTVVFPAPSCSVERMCTSAVIASGAGPPKTPE